jgi:2-aminoadipate transaminase
MVCEMWQRGTLTGRLPVLRAAYQRKRTVMEEALRRELGDLVTWPEPKGGFFLWASLALDMVALLPRAIEHGVVYVPGSAFFVDGSGAQYARLSFSWPDRARIDLGIKRFAQVVLDGFKTGGTRAPASPAASAEQAEASPGSAAGRPV